MLKTLSDIFKGIRTIGQGLAVTGKNMFRKPVTEQYPQERPTMTDQYRGMVDLIPEKCISCQLCVKICPVAALDLVFTPNPETKKKDINKFTFNGELCCYCGLCEEVCPTKAMYMNKSYEAAYYNHEDLISIDLLKADKYSHIIKDRPAEDKK